MKLCAPHNPGLHDGASVSSESRARMHVSLAQGRGRMIRVGRVPSRPSRGIRVHSDRAGRAALGLRLTPAASHPTPDPCSGRQSLSVVVAGQPEAPSLTDSHGGRLWTPPYPRRRVTPAVR